MKKLSLYLLLIVSSFSSANAYCPTNKNNTSSWSNYFKEIDNHISSILVDLSIVKSGPTLTHSNLISIKLIMNSPREDGLSSQSETETLYKIEDELIPLISSKTNAIYVGRTTTNGYREFYFYSPDISKLASAITEMKNKFPNYKFESTNKLDLKWDFYLKQLTPTNEEIQMSENIKVVSQLVNAGDNLTSKREVFHWIYFKTEVDKELFLTKIKDLGFKIITNKKDKKEYVLNISRVDYVDIKSVNEYCIMLWKIANECHAVYDGWETSVEK